MIIVRKICVLAAVLVLSVPAFAENFYINDVTGTDDKSLTTNIKALVTNAVMQEGHQVSTVAGSDQTVLSPTLMKLGSSMIITLSKSKNGQLMGSQNMKALSVDEIDLVSQRLTKAVINNKSLKATQTVDSVSQKEELGTSVVMKAKKQFYVGFGPGRVINLGTNKAGIDFTAGYLFGLDHQFSLRAAVEAINISDSNSDHLEFMLGGQYYLNKNNQSPYAVGGLTYGRSEAHIEKDICKGGLLSILCSGEKENGFGVKLGVGMHFYRSTSVNFAVEATYSQHMFTVNDKYPGATGIKILVLY